MNLKSYIGCSLKMILITYLIGCTDPPTYLPKADFIGVTSPNRVVYFQNQSAGAASYLWDFGDGTTSAQASPTHTYSDIGQFLVKLTAKGAGTSNENTQKKFVDVFAEKGKMVFWVSNVNEGEVEIFIDGGSVGFITSGKSSDPGCGAAGCVTVSLDEGIHEWEARWAKARIGAEFSISNDTCTPVGIF